MSDLRSWDIRSMEVSIGSTQLVLLGLSPMVAIPSSFMRLNSFFFAGSIELLNCILNLIWSESQPFCELRDGVYLLRLLVGGVLDPPGPEPIHNRLICNELRPLILVAPSL